MSTKSSKLSIHQEAVSDYLSDLLGLGESSLDSKDDNNESDSLSVQSTISVTSGDWREASFQALLFNVQGLKLAIPLHELNGILTWPEPEPSKINEAPSHSLGLYDSTHVIATSHIVLPSQHQNDEDVPSFIISIDNGRWGLACNAVENVITLSPDDVKWRQLSGKRPWLAGTVLEQMCSILNIKELIKLL